MSDTIKVQYVGGKPHSVMSGDGEEYTFEPYEIKEIPGFTARFILSKFPEDENSANVKGFFFKKVKGK